MLDQADTIINQISKSHESLQKKEQEIEVAKAKCLKYIEQLTREAEDKEQKWKKREADVARVSQPSDVQVSIKARGTKFEIKKSVLMTQMDSLLAQTFSGAHELDKDN